MMETSNLVTLAGILCVLSHLLLEEPSLMLLEAPSLMIQSLIYEYSKISRGIISFFFLS